MKLILLSSNNEIIKNYLKKGKKVGFIPTASELDKDRWYMEKDRDKLLKMGYIIENIEVTSESTEQIKYKINSSDALFIAGGNSYYLLQQLKQKDVITTIVEFINSNKLYIGASAGSVIACPTIEVIEDMDNPKEAPLLKSFEALNVIDFYILPHYNSKEKYTLKADLIAKKYSKLEFLKIRDNQAIIVTDRNEYKIVDTE